MHHLPLTKKFRASPYGQSLSYCRSILSEPDPADRPLSDHRLGAISKVPPLIVGGKSSVFQVAQGAAFVHPLPQSDEPHQRSARLEWPQNPSNLEPPSLQHG